MRAAIIVVGDEILTGDTLDTNSNWLAKRLADLGVRLVEVRTVADEATAIQGAIWEVQERRDAAVTLVCGGLGPTHDDRTVAAVAALHGVALVADANVEQGLRERYAAAARRGLRQRAGLGAARKMTLVPRGAEVYLNPAGAAPGLGLARSTRDATRWTFVLPGVPEELRALWTEHVEPRVVRVGGDTLRRRHVETLVYEGLESEAATTIAAVAARHPRVTIGSYPRWGVRRVVLRVGAADPESAEQAATALADALRQDGGTVHRERPPNP